VTVCNLTINTAMSTVRSSAHLWCTVHLDVLNNKMVTVQTLNNHTQHMAIKYSLLSKAQQSLVL